jgi:hypothetical protein
LPVQFFWGTLHGYDLTENGDYQKLFDELKKFKAIRVLKSQWFFKYEHNDSVVDLRDHFIKFIDSAGIESKDRLFICEVTDWASWRLLSDPNKL